MATTKETKRYRKKIFLGTVTLDHSLFSNCYFTDIFVHLSVTRVCYFSVYRLIACDPANISYTCLKLPGEEYVQS